MGRAIINAAIARNRDENGDGKSWEDNQEQPGHADAIKAKERDIEKVAGTKKVTATKKKRKPATKMR